MINGIEVLTSEMVRTSPEFDELIFVGILFIGFALVVFYCFGYCVKNKLGWVALVSAIGVILLSLVAGKMFKMAFFPTYEERYMVQLKKEVPLDFIKNYEILEDKGNDIYIVREKGNN
jgi:hypothetical protein